jgi:hypothetical protein
MKAGSLQVDDYAPLLCESPERRHPEEKCASKCLRGTFLSAFIYFLAQWKKNFELRISDCELSDMLQLVVIMGGGF